MVNGIFVVEGPGPERGERFRAKQSEHLELPPSAATSTHHALKKILFSEAYLEGRATYT